MIFFIVFPNSLPLFEFLMFFLCYAMKELLELFVLSVEVFRITGTIIFGIKNSRLLDFSLKLLKEMVRDSPIRFVTYKLRQTWITLVFKFGIILIKYNIYKYI